MAELCQGQVKLVPAKLDVTRKEIRNEGLFIIKGGWIIVKWEGKPHMFPNQIQYGFLLAEKESMVWKDIGLSLSHNIWTTIG